MIVAVVLTGMLNTENTIIYDSKSTFGSTRRATYRLGLRRPDASSHRESGITGSDIERSSSSAAQFKIPIPLSSLEKGRSDTDVSAELGVISD